MCALYFALTQKNTRSQYSELYNLFALSLARSLLYVRFIFS